MVASFTIGTVLVVDDNAENRALAQATLDGEGIAALVASNAEEALALVASHRPDCILLDIRMPGTDGVAVCERIRAMPGGDQIAIVFVTAQRDVETFDRAVAAGGDDFLTKPFRPGELLVRVQTALRLRRFAAERSELAGQLKHQRDELQRLQLQKEVLTGFLVHDLKNPVSTIELQAQRIARNAKADERSKDAAAKIHDETRALLRMITNLLDIGKADEGRLAPNRVLVDVRELVSGAIEELAMRAEANQVTLVAEVQAIELNVDRELVRRILANLIDNAIRHAPEHSEVRIVSARVGDATELAVIDRGAGIPADARGHVFERFTTTGGGANRGLGLSFCKLAVEAHGGTIEARDADPGAVLAVRFPDM